MRVTLSDKSRIILFSHLRGLDLNNHTIATLTGVSIRTVTDWKRGKYSIRQHSLSKLTEASGIDTSDLELQIVGDWANNSVAGKLGAKARALKHGPLGTTEGRRRGGERSYSSRRSKPNDIFARNSIYTPVYSEDLAELTGIMIGDGGITDYQVCVALSLLVDLDYSTYVVSLFHRLFGITPHVTDRDTSNCRTLVVSSIELVEFLMCLGLPKGNKVRQQHDIPAWVRGKRDYEIACIRGIFDTDGCIFQERHGIKDKLYCYSRMSFVTASQPLRESIFQILTDLGFNPKMRNERSVNLEKASDINRYFRLIGSSNPKHIQRFHNFGGVG